MRWISREAPVSFPTLSRHRHRADRLAWHALAARLHVRRERREFRVPLPARVAGDALGQQTDIQVLYHRALVAEKPWRSVRLKSKALSRTD